MSAPPQIAILGQGLAGTLVSLRLRQNGLVHRVYDRGHERASSHAAAGIINPVTGRRFVLVGGYEEYRAAFGSYRFAQQCLGQPFLHDLLIYRDLSVVRDRNQWDMRRSEEAYGAYLDAPVAVHEGLGLSPKLPATWLGPTRGAQRLDMAGLIGAYRVLLKSEQALCETDIGDTGVLRQTDGSWRVLGDSHDIVVDCRGAGAATSRYWSDLPWRLSKGEAIRVQTGSWPTQVAVKVGGLFVSPISAGEGIWYGGTSSDHFEVDSPSPETQARLRAEVTALDLGPRHNAVESLSAIRPTMRDRQTLAVRHPKFAGLYLCNGFGTKGALVGPSVVDALWSILAADLALGD